MTTPMSLISLCTIDKLLAMRALYAHHGPGHYLGYNTLDNFINWRASNNINTNSNSNIQVVENISRVRIYTLSEQSWRERGLYLIVHEYQLFVNSTQPEDGDLAIALKLLDWTYGYKITSVPQQQLQTVTQALHELDIEWRSGRMNVYRRVGDKVGQLPTLPIGLSWRSLYPTDAELVNATWPSRNVGSLEMLQCLIACNQSIGVYCESSKELIAWCTRCQCGFLGTLHVQPSHRRQGIASLVLEALANRVVIDAGAATKDPDVFALVYEGNVASNKLLRKMHYELIGNVYHIRAFHNPSSFE